MKLDSIVPYASALRLLCRRQQMYSGRLCRRTVLDASIYTHKPPGSSESAGGE